MWGYNTISNSLSTVQYKVAVTFKEPVSERYLIFSKWKAAMETRQIYSLPYLNHSLPSIKFRPPCGDSKERDGMNLHAKQ